MTGEVEQAILDKLDELQAAVDGQRITVENLTGSPYICKGCGVTLGYIVKIHTNGRTIKGFRSWGVIWAGAKFGHCAKCGAKVFFD